jgi:hypothetical protein
MSHASCTTDIRGAFHMVSQAWTCNSACCLQGGSWSAQQAEPLFGRRVEPGTNASSSADGEAPSPAALRHRHSGVHHRSLMPPNSSLGCCHLACCTAAGLAPSRAWMPGTWSRRGVVQATWQVTFQSLLMPLRSVAQQLAELEQQAVTQPQAASLSARVVGALPAHGAALARVAVQSLAAAAGGVDARRAWHSRRLGPAAMVPAAAAAAGRLTLHWINAAHWQRPF